MSAPPTSSNAILEGVLGIHKPGAISSAQVIRDVQTHFNPSKLFAPLIEREQQKLARETHNQKQKRRQVKKASQVKIGHGGTLDPMATGVLILGIGNGTKALGSFLECQKTYECVVLFGAATDTYDAVGKVVGRKPFAHIKREAVESTFDKFRGNIMQKPPIFSALRIDGKRLYEYAREGKELPREIEERSVEVKNLEMVQWYEGGTHQWHWPVQEAGKEEKNIVEKVLHLGAESTAPEPQANTKRKRDDEADASEHVHAEQQPEAKRARPDEQADESNPTTTPPSSSAQRQSCPAPAVRLRMTVSSGFYVRSLCHDLGTSLDSLALMSSLVRTQQGDFELGKNVLEYDDLAKGEDSWAPRVRSLLEDWKAMHGGEEGEEKAAQAGKEAARRHDQKRNQTSGRDINSSAGRRGKSRRSDSRGSRSPLGDRNTSSSGE